MKILYIAPLDGFSGYATGARDFVRALNKQGADIATRPLSYDVGGYKMTKEENLLRRKPINKIDVIIQNTTPNEMEYKEGAMNIAMCAWETTRICQEWVDQLNKMHLVLTFCDETVKAFKKSGVITPIEKIHYAFNLSKYKEEIDPFEIPEEINDYFKFLTICQASKKKGLDSLLVAYLSEFKPEDKVILILKAYFDAMQPNPIADTQKLKKTLNAIKQGLRLNRYPPVYIKTDILSENEIARLYKTADCYVLPSRAEGFSITHFDAMGYGVPPIALGWGGPVEFIKDKKNGFLVNYTMAPVFGMDHPMPNLYTGYEKWAEADLGDLMQVMRDAVNVKRNKPDIWENMVKCGKNTVNNFSYDIIGEKLMEILDIHYKRYLAIKEL